MITKLKIYKKNIIIEGIYVQLPECTLPRNKKTHTQATYTNKDSIHVSNWRKVPCGSCQGKPQQILEESEGKVVKLE